MGEQRRARDFRLAPSGAQSGTPHAEGCSAAAWPQNGELAMHYVETVLYALTPPIGSASAWIAAPLG
jgi:hypothetical protein